MLQLWYGGRIHFQPKKYFELPLLSIFGAKVRFAKMEKLSRLPNGVATSESYQPFFNFYFCSLFPLPDSTWVRELGFCGHFIIII